MTQVEATSLVDGLFQSLGVFLVRFAVRRTHSIELAEDIVQEAFLSLYRDLRRDKRIEDPRAWTIGAVRNQIRKHVRDSTRHREQLTANEDFDLLPAGVAEVPFGEPLLLAGLTPREEEVVVLRLQSMKYREIAEHLGIGAKSVCTLLARAVRKLQSKADARRSGRTAVPGREVHSALQ